MGSSDSSTISLSGGNRVSTLNDKSGNNHHFSQSGADTSKLKYENTINRLEVMTNNGEDRRLATTDAKSNYKFLHDGSDHSACLVLKPSIASETFSGIIATTTGSSGQIGWSTGIDRRSSNSADMQRNVIKKEWEAYLCHPLEIRQ